MPEKSSYQRCLVENWNNDRNLHCLIPFANRFFRLQIFPAKNVVFVDCHFDGRLFRLSPCQRERTEVRGSSFADAPVPWSNPHPPPLPCEGRGDPCDARRTAD